MTPRVFFDAAHTPTVPGRGAFSFVSQGVNATANVTVYTKVGAHTHTHTMSCKYMIYACMHAHRHTCMYNNHITNYTIFLSITKSLNSTIQQTIHLREKCVG